MPNTQNALHKCCTCSNDLVSITLPFPTHNLFSQLFSSLLFFLFHPNRIPRMHCRRAWHTRSDDLASRLQTDPGVLVGEKRGGRERAGHSLHHAHVLQAFNHSQRWGHCVVWVSECTVTVHTATCRMGGKAQGKIMQGQVTDVVNCISWLIIMRMFIVFSWCFDPKWCNHEFMDLTLCSCIYPNKTAAVCCRFNYKNLI